MKNKELKGLLGSFDNIMLGDKAIACVPVTQPCGHGLPPPTGHCCSRRVIDEPSF
jgi:hypothetical protein